MRIAAVARGHPHVVAAGCFTVLALALAGPALLGRAALGPDSLLDWDPLYRGANAALLPIFNDFTPITTDLPKDSAIARGLHAGRFDGWNPLSACGVPLWAEESGPFFPLKLPFYLVPQRTTYHLFLTLRLIFAALGAYFLARRGLELVPAIAAGASFELSGTMIAQLPFGVFSPSYVLPWVILGSFAIAERRTAAAAAGAGIALGLAAHGGHPTAILLVYSAFVAAIAGHIAAAWRQPRVAMGIAGHAALACVLGIALAAPVLLPLVEMASVGSSYKNRRIWAGMWVWLLQQSRTTLPIALFAPATFQSLYPELRTIFAFAPSIGVLGLVVAVAGIGAGGLNPALIAVGVLGIGLATAPPGLMWLHRVPGLSLIVPTYAWSLFVLPLTQAAGSGIHALCGRRGWRVGLAALALWTASAIVVLWIARTNLPGVAKLLDGALGRPADVARRMVALPVIAATVIGACLVMTHRGLATVSAAVLTAAVVVEQLITMAPFTRQQASAVLTSDPSPAVRFLQRALADGNARMTALPYRLGYPITTMLFDLPDLRGVSALPIGRYYDYLHALSPKAGTFTNQEVSVISSPLLDLAAVRYLALPVQTVDWGVALEQYTARRPGDPPMAAASLLALADALLLAPPYRPKEDDPMLPVVYRDERVIIYENRAALGRVRIAHEAIPMPDRESADRWIGALGAKAEHAATLGLESAVIIEPDEHRNLPAAVSGELADGESVRIVPDADPDMLVIDAHLDHSGLVVIADTYYPGWEAWVDDHPTSIYPANLAFRAVYVPAGSHRIVLRYRQRWLRYGLLIAATSGIACIVLLARDRRVPRGPIR